MKSTDRIGAEKLARAITGGPDYEYRELVRLILSKSGKEVVTRGHKCRRVIHVPIVFTSTPLVSLRKTAWRNCLREWEWFMSGRNDIKSLHPAVKDWWKPWASAVDTVPFNYSEQFRSFVGWQGQIDQIQYLIDSLNNHRYGRRACITTWNTAEMVNPACPITNCHGSFIQCWIEPDNRLTMLMYQRSADVICGVPHNWLQYWGFLMWLANRTGTTPGEFHWIGGDCHIYEQHRELAEMIANMAIEPVGVTPQLVYQPSFEVIPGVISREFRADDFTLDREYRPILMDRAELVV